MDERPEIAISAENDVAAFPPVATVRAASGDVLFSPEMEGTASPLPRTAINFYVIYEIGIHFIGVCMNDKLF
jgi:hypothetical protein